MLKREQIDALLKESLLVVCKVGCTEQIVRPDYDFGTRRFYAKDYAVRSWLSSKPLHFIGDTDPHEGMYIVKFKEADTPYYLYVAVGYNDPDFEAGEATETAIDFLVNELGWDMQNAQPLLVI